MSQKSIKKNYICNLIYQLLTLVTPLITTPYLSRTLGASAIGTYSFASSIVTYFILFATMGTAVYGQREISYVQDDREKRTEIFWNTELLSCISTALVLVIYGIFVVLFSENILIYIIFSMRIVSVACDITWLYWGMEEFGKVVGKNIFFKIMNIILIFIFIHTKEDIVKYIFIVCSLQLFGMLSLWTSLFRMVDKPNWSKLKPFTNFKIVISMFIPTIAISIYTVLDKTMLGILTGMEVENGYYEQALNLSKAALAIVTALGTVMIPRIGYYYEKKETELVKKYIYQSYRFVWFLAIPLCFGINGIAYNVVPWFLGEGFDKVIPLLRISSFLIIAIGISNVTGNQYLMPTKRQNIYTYTVLAGAGINFVLNMAFIPKRYSAGAAFASVIAEMLITIIQLFFVRKELSCKKIVLCSKNYLISGVVMYGMLRIFTEFLEPGIINSLLLIVCGVAIYFMGLIIQKDDFFVSQIKNFTNKLSIHVKQ